MKDDFWERLDQLTAEEKLYIDRPKGSRHPIYPDSIYPLDYGYLEGTHSPDGEGIDVWMGTAGYRTLTGLIVTLDTLKHDTEIKLLLGCTEQETQAILAFHNQNRMRAIHIPRPKDDA
ncbi:MAG: inorganic pyrophosphatase [Anaerolineales bacterium]